MKLKRLCYVEMRRMLRVKGFWLTVLLCCCFPFPGMKLRLMVTGILTNKYIAQPLMFTAVAGGILWAVLTISEASRTHRSSTDVLTDAVSAPALLPAARMLAQMILSAGTALLCMLLWMPYTAYKMEFLFSAGFYILNYIVFLIPIWWISMLFAESFYQLTRRPAVASVIYALAAGCCALPAVRYSHSLNWLVPIVITYSDAFPTYLPLRIIVYARCIWLLIALSCWLLSLAAVRKYGRGLLTSFFRGCRKIILPLGAVCMTVAAVLLACYQPFSDHGPSSWTMEQDNRFAAEETPLSAAKPEYSMTLHMDAGTVSGTAQYEILNSKGLKLTTHEIQFLLNCGYEIDTITLNDEKLPFETLNDDYRGWRTTKFTLPDAYKGTLTISYHGMPTQKRSAMPLQINNSVDPEFTSLFNTAVLPWLLNIEVTEYGSDFNITLPEGITPFLDFREFQKREPAGEGNLTWHTKVNETPFSLLAGRYETEHFEAAGTQVNFTYGEIYHDTVKENDLCGAVKSVLDYCTEHYGLLPHAEEGSLSLMQTSALILGGWASNGWSTWMEETITPEALKDEKNGASAKEVFYHEMIHQWWGGLGVNFSEDDNLWSCEGMTVYSTYRLVKELYGEQYAKTYYVDQWKKNVLEQSRNFYNRHPEYLDKLPNFMQNSLAESNKQINLYDRMPLMLLKAEEKLGGEEEMDALLNRIFVTEHERQGMSPEMLYYSFDDFLRDSGLNEEDMILHEDDLL